MSFVLLLGTLFYHGIPNYCKQDYLTAFQYYNIAAENGNLDAWRNIISMYLLGLLIPLYVHVYVFGL